MEKHPKVGRNLVLQPRKDFRDTDKPGKQPLNVAATCELDGNAWTCPAAILYPSALKAQVLYTISINVAGKRRQAYATRPKRSMGRNHRNNNSS